MQVLDIQQGSDSWLAVRMNHFCASEAAAMLGFDKRTTRTQLLHMKHTGIGKEFSEWVQKNLLDKGHEIEADTRQISEKIIGEDLYPCIGTTEIEGIKLLASFDGITIGEETIWEGKSRNADLIASLESGQLPDTHWPQVEQQLLISKAEKALFTCGDGTEQGSVLFWYASHPERRATLIAGWHQFAKDLAEYKPVEVVVELVATPTLNLPAVSIKVEGSIALLSNLDKFGDALKQYISKIPAKPATDQEFVDCKAAIKKLQEAQDALDAAEANALGQIATFDEMRNVKALLFELARTTRLATEKLVTSREKTIKEEIVTGAREKLVKHVADLNTRLGRPYMPTIQADFAGAIKSKRTIASLQNAVDTLLAEKKIEADAISNKLMQNLLSLRELAKDHAFLFSDTSAIIMKDNADLVLLIESRIAAHEKTKADETEALRVRIESQERAKAEAAAAETLRREREADEARIAAEKRAAQTANAPQPDPAHENLALRPPHGQETVASAHANAQASQIATAPTSVDTGALMNLGTINARLDGVTVNAEFLERLGFLPSTTLKNSKLYREADFQRICAEIMRHIQTVASTPFKAAA